MQPVGIIEMATTLNQQKPYANEILKQVFEQRIHRTVRAEVRACTKPWIFWNTIESGMSLFSTEVLRQKLREGQNALLQRLPYQRGLMDQPKKSWSFLRSTNLIERFKGGLRRRLNAVGAMFGENGLWKPAGRSPLNSKKDGIKPK